MIGRIRYWQVARGMNLSRRRVWRAEDDPGENEVETEDATGVAADGDENSGEKVTLTPEQQAAFDRIIGERLARAKAKWDADAQTAAEKAKQEAETKRLEEQHKFEELAQKRGEKLTEMEAQLTELAATNETAATELQRYKDAFGKYLEAQREGLPQAILALLDDRDPLSQMEWLAENADEIRSKKGGLGTPVATAKPSTQRDNVTTEKAGKRKLAAFVRNSF